MDFREINRASYSKKTQQIVISSDLKGKEEVARNDVTR
jgi:hypothetical protein